MNLVLFNKAWFIVKKKKKKKQNKKLYIYIYIMGDLVTCPRYLYATFRKKKENTQTLIRLKIKIKK